MSLNDYEAIAVGLLGKKMGVRDRTHITKADVRPLFLLSHFPVPVTSPLLVVSPHPPLILFPLHPLPTPAHISLSPLTTSG